MPGHSILAARGEALRREEAVLAEAGIDPASFAAGGEEMQGARRTYRIAPEELRIEPAGPQALAISFALPRGAYAVSVLREITKSDVSQADFPPESNV
jgi:tRNA pseudouridine13 synthase